MDFFRSANQEKIYFVQDLSLPKQHSLARFGENVFNAAKIKAQTFHFFTVSSVELFWHGQAITLQVLKMQSGFGEVETVST